jgi:hypothetical protein
MATQDSPASGLGVEELLAVLGLPTGERESAVPYTVIRGNQGPRWLLPNESRIARTILGEWRPYGLATHLLWRGLRAAARLGMLPLVPGTEQIRLPRACAAQLLGRFGFEAGAAPPVLLVGNTQSTRKLLVFLEAAGRGNVVIKMPLTPLARASLGNEAEVLKRLNGERGAPRLLGYQLDTGAAMQEYLAGRMGWRRLKPDYLQLLLDLARRGETLTLRARARGLRERLEKCEVRGENTPDPGASGESQAAVERALALLEEDTPLPAALVHGDFAPWNLRHLRDGRCALIDWESAEWTGLPLHDLCHFFSMQAKLFAPHALFSETLKRDGSWHRYCAALQIEPKFFRPLVAAFLLASLARAREWGVEESAGYYLEQLRRFLQAEGQAVACESRNLERGY